MRPIGPLSPVRSLRSRRPLAVVAAIVLVAAVLGAGAVVSADLSTAPATFSPSPSEIALASTLPAHTAAPTPSPTPTPTPTAGPTPVPTAPPVAATTDGVLLPASEAALATRHPIAVMIDDQIRARPQSGLSQADIVYQAPAEGGIPRYMAIFQTQNPPQIGPIRSSRLYFVVWAEEWRAMYVHVGGATNALQYLAQYTGTYFWNADEFHWGPNTGYMWRVAFRAAPHNVYSSGVKLEALAQRVGASAPFTKAPWTFTDDLPAAERPSGGTIVVPYPGNHIVYYYDQMTNTYLRSVTGETIETDAGNGLPVAPKNVVVLYQAVSPLLGSNNPEKGRLEIGYLGSGAAMVFRDGLAIAARWSKASNSAPTLLTYANGPQAGQPVALDRGQIFIQVVPVGMNVTWTTGTVAAQATL